MRARTTWNMNEILSRTAATSPTAAMSRTADPYAMNQEHSQPPANKYLTGDPSAFAEDVTTPNNWDPEYSGGAVKRDEIGLAEPRPDTFNHPEKTASAINQEAILKKADITVRIARKLLGANAPEVAVEEQAASLMHMPDQDVINTYNRLAGEMPPQFKDNAEKKKEEAKGQAQDEAKQAAVRGDKAAFEAAIAKLVKFAAEEQFPGGQFPTSGQQQQAQGQPQQGQPAQQQQAQMQDQSAWYDSKGPRPGHSGPDSGPHAGQQQQAQGQPQQQMPAQQQAQEQMPPVIQTQAQGPQGQPQQQGVEAEVQQMIEQAAQQQLGKMANDPQQGQPAQQQQQAAQQQQAQGQPQQGQPAQQQQAGQQQGQPAQQQQQAAGQACGPMQQQAQGQPQQQAVQANDDQLLDQMLMPGGGQGAAPGGPPIAEMDIQMEAPSMDIGDVAFQPGEDEMLKQLFASGDEALAAQQAQDAQQGGQAQQQHQANVRTAAMRTIGTRPSAGVSRIGGAGAPPSRGQEVDKLTSLWQSAPDVREVFGLKT